MKPTKGKWYHTEYGYDVVRAECIFVMADSAIMRFRWAGPFRDRHSVQHNRILTECEDPRWLKGRKGARMGLRKQVQELSRQVAKMAFLEQEIAEFRKWKNSIDWSARMARLECLITDADRELQCFHDWRHMYMHDGMIIFHCERCCGIQRRKWQDLTEQEIQGLELLGIHKPEGKDK